MPLGNEKGWGYLHRIDARSDSCNNYILYEFDTVPQLSQVSNAHLEGLITNLLLICSTYNSGFNPVNHYKLPSSCLGYTLP